MRINPVIAWLESPEGEQWSRAQHSDHKVCLMVAKADDVYSDIWDILWVA